MFFLFSKSNTHKPGSPAPKLRAGGFTLIELMVVIAIIAIVASILLPAISRSKEKGRQINCLNNMRQIGLAFRLYHGDFNDLFPAPGSKQRYGPQPEDWIWWQYGRNITNSSIARYLDGFNPKMFTCPTDREAFDLQGKGALPDSPYRYSYSLTSHDLKGERNIGMATIITVERKVYPYRASMILNPSDKIMLAEESRATVNDPRFVPSDDKLADRHNGRCNVLFADGHIKTMDSNQATNSINTQPGL